MMMTVALVVLVKMMMMMMMLTTTSNGARLLGWGGCESDACLTWPPPPLPPSSPSPSPPRRSRVLPALAVDTRDGRSVPFSDDGLPFDAHGSPLGEATARALVRDVLAGRVPAGRYVERDVVAVSAAGAGAKPARLSGTDVHAAAAAAAFAAAGEQLEEEREEEEEEEEDEEEEEEEQEQKQQEEEEQQGGGGGGGSNATGGFAPRGAEL